MIFSANRIHHQRRLCLFSFAAAAALCGSANARNVVIFVADGLRPSSVTVVDAPHCLHCVITVFISVTVTQYFQR